LTPRLLASRAEAMAREAGLSVDILDEKKIAELKMGALLSVGAGQCRASEADRGHLYAGKIEAGRLPFLGLVGKGDHF